HRPSWRLSGAVHPRRLLRHRRGHRRAAGALRPLTRKVKGHVEIDVGLDATGLPYESAAEITAEAARLGYTRIWGGSVADPFQICALRWSQTRAARPGGIGTAIGVIPVGVRTPADLAQSAAALSQLTEGRFVLGIGAGTVYEPSYRRAWGIEEGSAPPPGPAHL